MLDINYEFSVSDMFAVLGGSGGCNLSNVKWTLHEGKYNGIIIKLDDCILYMPDYISVKQFITNN